MFINVNGLGQIAEPTYAPAGTYPLVITEAGEYTKVGMEEASSIKVTFEISGEPNFYSIDTYLGLPKDTDAVKTQISKARRIQRLCRMAGVTCDGGFDPADLIGAQFDARLGVEPITDRFGVETGKMRNYVVITAE